MKFRFLFSVCIFVLFGGVGCIEPVLPDEPALLEESAPPPKELAITRIIFAANLANGKNCNDRNASNACDLYEATLDLETGEVANVRQVTNTEQSESHPAWNPNGNIAYFTVFNTPRSKDIGFVDVSTGKTNLLQTNAAWATVHPAGDVFLYVSETTDMLMEAALSREGTSLKNATPLTGIANQQDPDFSSDGRYIVFHETGGEMTHGTVYDRETEQSTSYDTRSGHCTFGENGLITLCDNAQGGGIFSRMFANGKLGASELFLADLRPNDIAKYDPVMEDCNGTSFNYPTFCGDDEHLLVSASCNQGGAVIYSRLFLIDFSLEVPRYLPIGKHIAEAFDGPGNSTWTVDCITQ